MQFLQDVLWDMLWLCTLCLSIPKPRCQASLSTSPGDIETFKYPSTGTGCLCLGIPAKPALQLATCRLPWASEANSFFPVPSGSSAAHCDAGVYQTHCSIYEYRKETQPSGKLEAVCRELPSLALPQQSQRGIKAELAMSAFSLSQGKMLEQASIALIVFSWSRLCFGDRQVSITACLRQQGGSIPKISFFSIEMALFLFSFPYSNL